MLSMFPTDISNRWSLQSGSFAARSRLQYIVNNTATVLLPAAPRNGDIINIIVPYGSNVITFNPSGNKINNNSGNYLFYANSSFTSQLTLFFIDINIGWMLNNNLSQQAIEGGTFNRLNYIDSTDKNDVFYYLGSAKNSSAYANPYNVSVGCVASSLASSTLENVPTNATNGTLCTNADANSWIAIDLGYNNSSRRIRPLSLVMYSGSTANSVHAPRTFSVQGTNAVTAWATGNTGGTWTAIKAYSGDTRMSQTANLPALYTFTDSESTTFYRYIRIYQTGVSANGVNNLCTGRWCLYGDIINF